MGFGRVRPALLGLLSAAALAGAAFAADWPQWGGRNQRNFASDEKGIPATFSPGGEKTEGDRTVTVPPQNIKWAAKLGSQTYGNPTVSGGKVFIGDEKGKVTVLAAAKEKKVLHEVNFGVPVYTTPIVANGVLYIASQTHLYAIQAVK
jgi:outer membrane protein assembly factor BamB